MTLATLPPGPTAFEVGGWRWRVTIPPVEVGITPGERVLAVPSEARRAGVDLVVAGCREALPKQPA
jgi:hypothetical protein